jgi:prevent-host-death family protein
MDHQAHGTRITIRELQRNAADVLDHVQAGCSFTITRHGVTAARIVPPDPAEEAVERAIAAGVLDPAVLDDLPSTAEVTEISREPSPPGTRLGSDAVLSLRDEDPA